ncbi:hypothetical protein AK830_g1439 [Neonectria ditissima]|uniref:RGS domain-containing protein n=1 Tax=Neonectria ditissima TaxID=78410 RepID=A0A0N8H8N3_9HYPO|nr:hypothetical protein AK830_g1439 [Neonectria ditissima]
MRFLPLTYTRPKHVDQRPRPSSSQSRETSFSDSEKSDGSVKSGQSGCSNGIPESLAFENIINGGTCPPLTVRDFMTYLIYVEHAAENLQFYLWYKNYEKRFLIADTADVRLAPEWSQAMQNDAISRIRKETVDKVRKEPITADIFKGSDFEKQGNEKVVDGANPFSTPPQSSRGGSPSMYTASNAAPSTNASSYQTQASEAFQAAGVRQPFTVQPYREEINRVIVNYIMDDAPRQLNLSAPEQRAVLMALSHTTHPTAFRGIFKTIDSTLRRQAHPNFVRWSICNGNPARVCFARSLGVGLIISGLTIGIVLALSGARRGYRALSGIALVLGISTLVAAYKGMCVVLHGMHHRHVRPWELFVDSERPDSMEKRSFESFESSNSYEDEPWVVKYKKRNLVRKVFDREVWIQEPALRQIQDTIFVQAMLASLILGGILTAILVAVPSGNYF